MSQPSKSCTDSNTVLPPQRGHHCWQHWLAVCKLSLWVSFLEIICFLLLKADLNPAKNQFDITRHVLLGKAGAAPCTQIIAITTNRAASPSLVRERSDDVVSQVLRNSFCCSTWQRITGDLVSFCFRAGTECRA